MRTICQTIVLYCCLLLPTFGQTGSPVVTQPAFPTADAEVTIIFDLKLAKDGRAKALLGKTDDVFLWSGAGRAEDSDAFEFRPAGQTEFSKHFAPGKRTALGNDRWQLKLVPRT